MPKVRRVPTEGKGHFSGVVGYTDVAIDTKRGRFTIRQEHAPGSPEEPMTAADRVEKFMDCAGRVLGEKGARGLLDQLEDFGGIKNVGTVMAMMAPKEGSPAKATV